MLEPPPQQLSLISNFILPLRSLLYLLKIPTKCFVFDCTKLTTQPYWLVSWLVESYLFYRRQLTKVRTLSFKYCYGYIQRFISIKLD